jgi:hypothetical protein
MKVDEDTDVEGDHLLALLNRVKERFLSSPALYESGKGAKPNSLEFATSETLDGLANEEKLAVLNELLISNDEFILADWEQILKHVDTPSSALFDVICAVVLQVLRFDPSLREEDERRAQEAKQAREAA